MKHFLLVLAILVSVPGLAQETNWSAIDSARKEYLKFFIGTGSVRMRDFATSPLIYKGITFIGGLGYKKEMAQKESLIELHYIAGLPKIMINNEYTYSSVKFVDIHYLQLFTLNRFSNQNWRTKIGGQINLLSSFRVNKAFGNNSLGIELINTLFGSVKTIRSVSRTESKQKKFLFLKWYRPPRKRSLSFQLNVGLYNSSFRNGFIYSTHGAVVNQARVFEGYQYNAFRGFRMSSILDYTFYCKNGNGIAIGYMWDALTTGEDASRFEYGVHTFKLSILFNTKNEKNE